MVISQRTDLDGIQPTNDKPANNLKLAGLWVSTQLRNQKPNTLYVLTGIDEHLLPLLDALDPSNAFVVYEANIGRLKAHLDTGAYQKLLADKRVVILGGELKANDYNELHNLQIARFTDIKPLRYNPTWNTAPGVYEAFLTVFAHQFNVVRKLQLTNYFDSIFWQASSINNIYAHCQSPDISILKDQFKDIPTILVGAGPSLDLAEDFLKSAQGRAIIIASNSSYRKLVHIGVTPDFVLAADPRNYTTAGFDGIENPPGFLVAPFITAQGIVGLFKGRSFCWSGDNNLLISTLRGRLGLPKGTTLEEKGTISISVADFAYLMGSRKLFLVGQDMAIRPDGQTHTKDSIYTDLNMNRTDFEFTKEIRRLPGNTLKEVMVTPHLYIYLKIFEEWVENHPQMKVFNTSAIGVKIKDVDFIEFETALKEIPDKIEPTEQTLLNLIEQAPEGKTTPQQWLEALTGTYEYAQKLFAVSTEAAIELAALPQKYYGQAYQSHRNVSAIFDYAQRINRLLDQRPDDYAILLDGYLKKTILEFQRTVATIEAENPNATSLLKNKSFFWALSEGLEPFVGVLKKVLEQRLQKA